MWMDHSKQRSTAHPTLTAWRCMDLQPNLRSSRKRLDLLGHSSLSLDGLPQCHCLSTSSNTQHFRSTFSRLCEHCGFVCYKRNIIASRQWSHPNECSIIALHIMTIRPY